MSKASCGAREKRSSLLRTKKRSSFHDSRGKDDVD